MKMLLLRFAFQFLIFSVLVAVARKSKNGGSSSGGVLGQVIYYASEELMTFKEAAIFCLSPNNNNRFTFGEVLSSTQNEAAGTALSLINEKTGTNIGGWLSLYKVNGQFVWGNKQAPTYKNWGSGQPSSAGDCLVLEIINKAPTWVTASCDSLRRAICQAYSYTTIFDYLDRTKQYTRAAASGICTLAGGTLASVLSGSENRGVQYQTQEPTANVPSKSPVRAPTAHPTAKPTKKKKKELPCCSKSDENCAAADTSIVGEVVEDDAAATCRCCCCKSFDDIACCSQSSEFIYCGCLNAPPSKQPKRQTFYPTLNNDNRGEPNEVIQDTATTTTTLAASLVIFLSAANVKIVKVLEESHSFIWSNGVSLKPISYLPRSYTSTYINWFDDSYPAQVNNDSCLQLRTEDATWVNGPCDQMLNGAMCQVETTKKYFFILESESPMTQDDAGIACATNYGQLVSMKTSKEYAKVQQLAVAAGVKEFWTSGRLSNSSYEWIDGQVFYRYNIPIGVINFFTGTTTGPCVAMTSTGEWLAISCETELVAMCESVNPAGTIPLDEQQPQPQTCWGGCLSSFQGDGICDAVCDVYSCQFDGDDCGECSPGCSYKLLDNGVCDPVCFNALCAFDKNDCFPSDVKSSETSGRLLQGNTNVSLPAAICDFSTDFCDPAWIGDGYCDLVACGAACDFDDCAQVGTSEQCAPFCSPAEQTNSVCDRGCDNIECGFDTGLCPPCSVESCNPINFCDPHTTCINGCNNSVCHNDLNVCTPPSSLCSPGCEPFMIGDHICDMECNTLSCSWDGGDCPHITSNCLLPINFDDYGCLARCDKPIYKFQLGDCPNECLQNGCTLAMLGNGVCDAACDYPICGMDGGDCAACAPGCTPFYLNNGHCDSICNVQECGYDGGDCITLSPTTDS